MTATPLPAPGGRTDLQGTVLAFDPATRAGSVVLDDGTTLRYAGAAFDAGGLLTVRPGQRVRLVVADGEIRLLTLVTVPDP